MANNHVCKLCSFHKLCPFNKIGIDLTKKVFNHGQLYVALSRVRSWAFLAVFFDNAKNDRLVKNYVYKELFV
ncbi:GSCOCG00010520001-RA-CDS [Cotesia congregata]|nr:GSCOCG00010520001-RA-CDS [Cotesia congregata]